VWVPASNDPGAVAYWINSEPLVPLHAVVLHSTAEMLVSVWLCQQRTLAGGCKCQTPPARTVQMALHKTLLQGCDSSGDPVECLSPSSPHPWLVQMPYAETLCTNQAWDLEVHEAEVHHRGRWLHLDIGITELGPRSFIPQKRQGRASSVQCAHHGCRHGIL